MWPYAYKYNNAFYTGIKDGDCQTNKITMGIHCPLNFKSEEIKLCLHL
jgi:hypothetical protein